MKGREVTIVKEEGGTEEERIVAEIDVGMEDILGGVAIVAGGIVVISCSDTVIE